MRNRLKSARCVATAVGLAAIAAFHAAEGNHYILPCNECRPSVVMLIGPGITGTWFDPDQVGQGFTIEVLPGEPLQFLIAWFVFAPEGGQTWIVGRGPINGTQAVVSAYQIAGSGARFPPNFDPANVGSVPWGTLIFTFSDCKHGFVEWNAMAPGYGSGAMDIARLATPAGLVCRPDGSGNTQGAGPGP